MNLEDLPPELLAHLMEQMGVDGFDMGSDDDDDDDDSGLDGDICSDSDGDSSEGEGEESDDDGELRLPKPLPAVTVSYSQLLSATLDFLDAAKEPIRKLSSRQPVVEFLSMMANQMYDFLTEERDDGLMAARSGLLDSNEVRVGLKLAMLLLLESPRLASLPAAKKLLSFSYPRLRAASLRILDAFRNGGLATVLLPAIIQQNLDGLHVGDEPVATPPAGKNNKRGNKQANNARGASHQSRDDKSPTSSTSSTSQSTKRGAFRGKRARGGAPNPTRANKRRH